jgi:hypothetical protein
VRKLKFRTNPKSDNVTQVAALISGAVKQTQWRFSKVSKQPGETMRITFATQLNLTRFIQAQRLKLRSRLDRPSVAAGYVLAIDPDLTWYTDEAPLIAATNLIIGPSQKYAFALKKKQSEHLSLYLSLISGMLDGVVSDAFVDEAATYEKFSAYALKEIELYWEFDSNNPIDYVEGIRQNVMGANANVSEVYYGIQNLQFDVQGQSPCLTIHITRDTKLKIYAKTNRRVRFEVTFKKDAINRAAERRTSKTLKELVGKLPRLAEEAAKRVNAFLQSIAAVPAPKSSFTSVQLIHAIAKACKTAHESEAVIAALVTYGRLTIQNHDPLKDIVHSLKDRGVLRNLKPRSKVYVVTNHYDEPLLRLRHLR